MITLDVSPGQESLSRSQYLHNWLLTSHQVNTPMRPENKAHREAPLSY
jgi:hypothetical protein